MEQWHIVYLTKSHPLQISLERAQKKGTERSHHPLPRKKNHPLLNGNGPMTYHTSHALLSPVGFNVYFKMQKISILLFIAMWNIDSSC